MERLDVVVVGSGPAGWAVAAACVGEGLATAVVGPKVGEVWGSTFGVWGDQVDGLPMGAKVKRATKVWGSGRELRRGYAVLDNPSVVAAFRAIGVVEVVDKVVTAEFGPRGATVVLGSGRRVACAVVVDASGFRRVLSGGPVRGTRVEQTAYGVVVRSSDVGPPVHSGEAVFMDWGLPPTFLYAVPLPGDRVLLEETSLAARPGIGWGELKDRLHARIGPVSPLAVERVRFPLDVPATPVRHRGCVPFGAAAGMVHPATGYSVGDVLATAPRVATAIAAGLARDPVTAAGAGRAAVWSPGPRVVHALRRYGLRALLGLPPRRLPEFFGAFFDLPEPLQRAYLSERERPREVAAAMLGVFRAVPWEIRRKLLVSRHSPPG
ncbi:lycopene cyclase family protein [Actinokineospora auranticolor]|uniref:Lycopene beta-cyclase n=1 Tax=Actinokineospora auranticolor TaxID=155976 RepID=A0A2S6GN93_9PSEU|nr:lycopene cyclase family protein [Actinokineospora auranticolor]PPK66704.1 lycopene beta-cyclase [Actinokineospora auranticolor]